MNVRILPVPLACAIAIAGLSGCGGTKVTSTNERSVGQQLMDLNAARSQNIITEKEYQRLRKRLIKKND